MTWVLLIFWGEHVTQVPMQDARTCATAYIDVREQTNGLFQMACVEVGEENDL